MMNSMNVRTRAAATLIWAALPCVSTATASAEDGRQSGPFRLAIFADKSVYKSGEPVLVTSVLTNESDHELSIFMTPRISFYWMELRLPTPVWSPIKDVAQLTEEGERRKYPGFSSARSVTLRPGIGLVDKFELSSLYDIAAPGPYRLTFSFTAPSYANGVTVISNELQVVVEGNPK